MSVIPLFSLSRAVDFRAALRTLSGILIAGAALAAGHAGATPVNSGHVEAELVAEKSAAEPGKPITVALRLQHNPHWHTYWRNPGDSGLPTRISWQLPEGWTAGPLQWPAPSKLPLGPLMNFGYDGEVFLLADLVPPANAKPGESAQLRAKGDWLVCSDVCIPESADLALTLPVAAAPAAPTRWQGNLAATRAALPVLAADWKFASSVAGKSGRIAITPPPGFKGTLADLSFFPFRENAIDNAAPQPLARDGAAYVMQVALADPLPADLKELNGIMVSPAGWSMGSVKALQVGIDPGQARTAASPAFSGAAAAPAARPATARPAVPSAPDDMTFIVALAFAFLGGLILNLMPCVFPVLGVKILGFVREAHNDPRILRAQGLMFLAGVLVSFWVLAGLLIALRAGGEALGWGFQLQSPGFVTALAILFLLMALNLFGVFEFGTSVQVLAGNAGGRRRGIFGEALLSGVLATLVATPCTAPFMGTALGYTLAQPAPVALTVFTALALGMAAPIVLLSWFPAALKWLPRPGAWMTAFKQFMAFPLLATVAWLAWILGAQRGNDAVLHLFVGLVLVAMAAWVYGRWASFGSRLGYLGTLVLIAGGIVFAWPDDAAVAHLAQADEPATVKPGELPWQPYSKSRLDALLAQGKPVFVDFTAAWCITCQVNKRIALHNEEVVRGFTELGIVPLKADWTTQDPAITAALAEFNRNAVPLYVMYAPKNPTGPIVMPEVLTPSIMLAEIARMRESARLAAF